MATLKRKRVSKKNKKSWRKNVDVTDVDDFLEDQRLEERLGHNVREKENSELFTIDTAGEPAVSAAEPETKGRIKSLRLREATLPKCFALLERRSAVPDPVVKRNHVKQKQKEKVLSGGVKKRKAPTRKLNFRNIWGEEDKTKELNGLSTWMTSDTVRNVLQNTGHKRKTRPHDLKVKPSPLAAVEAPHPGMSYNPSLADHSKLLQTVAEIEAATEKKEKHVERVTTKMFRKIPREEAEKDWITEMSAGLEAAASDSAPEGAEYSTVNPPVQRKKKTLQKRRKLREEREKKRALETRKMEKKKRADVNDKLTQLKQSIDKSEAQSLAYQKRKEIRKQEKVGETKILGKTRFEAPAIEFQCPSELVGSLRQLKPEGSVLADRFSSIQKRNIIEPTLIRNIRRAKVKRFVKPSHKMGWEPKGF